MLNKYKKNEVITTGSDNVELDSPTFEVVNINIDLVSNVLSVTVMHEVNQGSIIQKHSRSFDVPFGKLPTSVKIEGKQFLEAIEAEIMKLPQYSGGVKL